MPSCLTSETYITRYYNTRDTMFNIPQQSEATSRFHPGLSSLDEDFRATQLRPISNQYRNVSCILSVVMAVQPMELRSSYLIVSILAHFFVAVVSTYRLYDGDFRECDHSNISNLYSYVPCA